MPSQPRTQAWWKTIAPSSCSRCPFSRTPGRHPRSKLASVALRVSSGSRRRSVPSSSSRSNALEQHVLASGLATQQFEDSQAALVASDSLAVDQAGAHLERVHRRDNRRIAWRPVVAVARQQPNAGAVATSHQPEAVVLDLVHPARGGRWPIGRRRQARLDEAGETQTVEHAAVIGQTGAGIESRCLCVQAFTRRPGRGHRVISSPCCTPLHYAGAPE
jgi:hypothetical protein